MRLSLVPVPAPLNRKRRAKQKNGPGKFVQFWGSNQSAATLLVPKGISFVSIIARCDIEPTRHQKYYTYPIFKSRLWTSNKLLSNFLLWITFLKNLNRLWNEFFETYSHMEPIKLCKYHSHHSCPCTHVFNSLTLICLDKISRNSQVKGRRWPNIIARSFVYSNCLKPV